MVIGTSQGRDTGAALVGDIWILATLCLCGLLMPLVLIKLDVVLCNDKLEIGQSNFTI